MTAQGGDNLAIGVSQSNGPRAVAHTPYGLFFYHEGTKSVYVISGGNIQKISGPIDADLFAIESRVVNSTFQGMCLHWISPRNLLAVSFGMRSSGGLTNENNTWFYDPISSKWVGKAGYGFFNIASWTKTNTGTAQWDPNYSTVAFGENDNADKIFQILTGVDHNGSAVVPVLGLPTFIGDDPTMEKTFLYVDILTKPVAGETVKVEWYIDGASTADGSATVTLTGTDSRERHRINIGERGRELDIDITLDDATGNSGVYGTIYGYTSDTSMVGS